MSKRKDFPKLPTPLERKLQSEAAKFKGGLTQTPTVQAGWNNGVLTWNGDGEVFKYDGTTIRYKDVTTTSEWQYGWDKNTLEQLLKWQKNGQLNPKPEPVDARTPEEKWADEWMEKQNEDK